MRCNAPTPSSISREWVEAVRTSGRFADYLWHESQRVSVTTLDRLIEQYGVPVFCKIDVEGFEFQVLRGLSGPLKAVSFEFTPEFIDAAVNCVRYLSQLGSNRFNYSVRESMCLSLPGGVDADRTCELLLHLPNKSIFGDVYAACGS